MGMGNNNGTDKTKEFKNIGNSIEAIRISYILNSLKFKNTISKRNLKVPKEIIRSKSDQGDKILFKRKMEISWI